MFGSKLKRALRKATKQPEQLEALLDPVSDEDVRTAGEAELVVQLLSLFPRPQPADAISSALHQLTAYMQGTDSDEARAVFRNMGAPALLRVFDDTLPHLDDADERERFRLESDLMFVLKVAALYAPPGGIERLTRAAYSRPLREAYLWSVIFGVIGRDSHPWRLELVESLRAPVPEGFAGIAYLDLSNTLAIAGELENHPFDTEVGHRRLREWLTDDAPEHYSYAHSATASLPFMCDDVRAELLAVAREHPDAQIRLEASWATAKGGDERGLTALQEACADPRQASVAMAYLTELGADDRVPVHTRKPDFRAMAEMCTWLAHPSEFGRPPDEIALADTRELYWPPADDLRRVWLFRYEYLPEGDDDTEVGYGMVGSVTFALFGESTADRSVEEVYGLHCAWELEMNGDGRAPATRTPAVGVSILAEYNPGFGPA